MVEGIAGEGEAPPLDRMGEDDAGPITLVIRLSERLEDHPEVVAAEVRDEAREGRVVDPGQEAVEGRIRGPVVSGDEGLADRSGRKSEEALIPRGRDRLEAGPEPVAARPREQRLEA